MTGDLQRLLVLAQRFVLLREGRVVLNAGHVPIMTSIHYDVYVIFLKGMWQRGVGSLV
jgi:hypothetical protein